MCRPIFYVYMCVLFIKKSHKITRKKMRGKETFELMKIEEADLNLTEFSELKIGETFRYSLAVFLKVSPLKHTKANAVNLNDCQISYFNENAPVSRVKTVLKVNPY